MVGPRADYGQPIDGFFAKQSAAMRPLSDKLRALVDEVTPGAKSSLEWGMPLYTVGVEMRCAIGGHKSHVNLILPGAPGTFPDPQKLLRGKGKTGQYLKLTRLEELPEKTVRGWLKKPRRTRRRSDC